jgi:hypothetical protein
MHWPAKADKLTVNVFPENIYFAALAVIGFIPVTAGAQKLNEPLRAELLAMEKNDQTLRRECNEKGEKMPECYGQIAKTTDGPNTERLSEIVDKYGMPTAGLVGKDGFEAFMIVLQHATSDKLREKCLKPIRKAFRRKELHPQNYANFVDRLLVHQGKPQLYGSNFDLKDGKLVMSPVKDPRDLDKRRQKIGLMPIGEYMKGLEEMYHIDATK